MNFSKHSWLEDLICDLDVCLKCIMADYPQETDEIFCLKCDNLKKKWMASLFINFYDTKKI